MTEVDLDSLAELLHLNSLPDLDLIIEGRAITKGSGKAVRSKSTGRPVFLLDNAADQKEWAQIVRGIVRQHLLEQCWELPMAPKGVPVALHAEFAMPRKIGMRVDEPTPPHVDPPDWDKLARCLGDALEGLVYANDSQVNDPHAPKRYVEPGEEPHVRLRAWIG